jgi:uncharacterized protein YyaL (SSP411 family)
MNSRYIAVRVDQDSRPDLANRYEDYGWPATIVFASDGSEIVRRRGYLTPGEMSSLQQAIIDDPSPGPSIKATPAPTFTAGKIFLTDERRTELREKLLSRYDAQHGGWSGEHKFLDADNVEFCLRAAAQGDVAAGRIARDMLRLQRQLIDPVWGGVYQYSAEGDWVHPHFEKIMSMQTDNLRIYALAFAQNRDPFDEKTARAVQRYLHDFLGQPSGAFATSQDADLVAGQHSADYFALDDSHRRAVGIPRVDTHVYARENGWAITALCALTDATVDTGVQDDAVRAAHWIISHRAIPAGGFRHGETDESGPFLGDTLAMGCACFALYQTTGDTAWLKPAQDAADFVPAHFSRGSEPGFATLDTTQKRFPAPSPQFDESVALSRFANLLSRATGRASDRELGESALRWALAKEVTGARGPYVGGALLAEEERRTDPLHITIVGRKDDPAAQALFNAARQAPTTYKLIEWWDRREGPPPRGEAIFPEFDRPAAFMCANGACSSPLYDVATLNQRIEKSMLGKR